MTFRDTTSVFERLVENSTSTDTGYETPCWVWQKGCCNKGYGHFYIYDPNAMRSGKIKKPGRSVEVRAHIASYALAHGPIPTDMTLDHKCRVTKCIRPSHLELVTRAENSRRKWASLRALRGAVIVEVAAPSPQEYARADGPHDQYFCD